MSKSHVPQDMQDELKAAGFQFVDHGTGDVPTLFAPDDADGEGPYVILALEGEVDFHGRIVWERDDRYQLEACSSNITLETIETVEGFAAAIAKAKEMHERLLETEAASTPGVG